MDSVLPAGFWNRRYEEQQTGWDTGTITTPLKTYFEQLDRHDTAILIPGCGNSHEAAWLLAHGFNNVTLADISPVLTRSLREKFADRLGKGLTVITEDFFHLSGQYERIIEQTFFCALDPSQREAYVAKIYELLQPGGKLAGVLFDRTFEGGPPFGGSREEYLELFKEKFRNLQIEPCYNSIPPRAGNEVFIIAEK